jgi:hypothetical protein
VTALILFHTAASNVAVFSRVAMAFPDVRHVVRPDLLAAAEADGGLTTNVRRQAVEAMRAELRGERMICTCSTIGPAAEDLAGEGLPVRRADAMLAERAVADGGRVAVLYAVATTEASTRELFERVAAKSGNRTVVELVLVPDAWERFRNGEATAYYRAIAAAVDKLDEGFNVIALAQASMAPAAELCRRRMLTSPEASFPSD